MTATGTALQYVRNRLLFSTAAGARSGAKKVVFVLTDGRSNRGIRPGIPAGQLKRLRVAMFAMGVTKSIRNSELRAIASSSSHVFHVANFAALKQITQKIKGGELEHNIASFVANNELWQITRGRGRLKYEHHDFCQSTTWGIDTIMVFASLPHMKAKFIVISKDNNSVLHKW